MLELTPTRPDIAFAEQQDRPQALSPLGMVLLLLFTALLSSPARADVGVLLNESLDTSFARISGSGHSAVYFSRICPETPVKLRLCRPGEQGSVMSNYTTLGEDKPFEWNAVPLSVYLYGVEDPQNQPFFATWKIKHVLEERYRERFLSGYCESSTCRTGNGSEWREMVGATLERSIYMFVVDTTIEQDQALIDEFNSLPNENHFNGVTRNCATFVRHIINTYYPHSARADYVNDFGLITPKAITRSFAHFAENHPEAHLRVVHFAQLPGTIKRSTVCRNADEQLYRSKKLLVPMLLFADHALPFMAASYTLTARFNPETELEHNPTGEASSIRQQIRDAKSQNDTLREQELEALIHQESSELVGTSKEWKEYRIAFGSLADEAISREVIPNRDFLDRLFKYLDQAGMPTVDANGVLWLDLSPGGKTSRVGLSASSLFASGTDSQWAYAVILARANHYLKSPKHSREIMPDFKNDWSLLQSARLNTSTSLALGNLPTANSGAAVASFNPAP
jgi:hypothetical protein